MLTALAMLGLEKDSVGVVIDKFRVMAKEAESGIWPSECHSHTTSPVRTSTSCTIESISGESFPGAVPGRW